MNNELYIPYQNKSREWFFEDIYGNEHGPFISEELCESRANSLQERDED
jgi:hypothetical protein